MSAEYSVESLQHLILSQHASTSVEAIAALRAFQERLKADEGAVPDVVAIMSHLPDNRAATRAEMFRALRLAEQTHPPAQAAQSGRCEWCPVGKLGGTAEPAAKGEAVAGAPSTEAAEAMGAKGGPAVEAERLAFEAWMKGHCWTLGATWRDGAYRSDAEQGGKLCPHAMQTRGLWAAWRDRAALAALPRAVPDADTDRLEFLIKHHLRVKRLNASNLWMVLSHDGHPSTGGEYEEWREAIDEAMLAAAPSAPEAIPGGVVYRIDSENFYDDRTRAGKGCNFWNQWNARKGEFPTEYPTAPEGGEVDHG